MTFWRKRSSSGSEGEFLIAWVMCSMFLGSVCLFVCLKDFEFEKVLIYRWYCLVCFGDRKYRATAVRG